MAAAEVMRGEKTMDDITYDFEGETEIYGSRHPRPTALAKVTGLADYGDDVALQMPAGIAHLAVVLADGSPRQHPQHRHLRGRADARRHQSV